MATSYTYKMGNDNGNANHDIIINGDFFSQPNVNTRITNLNGYNETSTSTALAQVMDQIIATITSPTTTPGIYLVGKSALNSGATPNEIMVGFEKKCNSEIPIINTLGIIGAYAVKKHYDKTKKAPKNEDTINVNIEMNTALPIAEYHADKNNKEVFTNKFLNGPHTAVIHLGDVSVKVNIKFTKVYVTPEAASVYWFLDSLDNNPELAEKFFEEFLEEYSEEYPELSSITGKQVAESRILHVDIGSGTTEFPLTHKKPNPAFVTGKGYGIGHAIDDIVGGFGDTISIPGLKRLEFDEILKGTKMQQFKDRALQAIQPKLKEQAGYIYMELQRELRKARMEVDYILVYGGGSVLLKEFLYEQIKTLAAMTEKAKVIYVPAELAVKLNAYGLNAFVNHNVFEKKTANQTPKEESVEA